jgi:putative transcriptional regulator
LRERSFPFEEVTPAFDDPLAFTVPDKRRRYGEARLCLYGKERTDWARIDATTEAEIAQQLAEDDVEARRDAAAHSRRVRARVGLSQAAFARQIGVSVETVRSWEQGRRSPRGPARALLRLIEQAPDAACQAFAFEQ